jgi:hypothetical protein
MKTFRQVDAEEYGSESGETFRREHGKTPNGNPLNGSWVYRDKDGKFIDSDWYRHDLAERNDIELLQWFWPQ